MEDAELISLFESDGGRAVSETDKKYGTYCRRFAERILGSREDAEECVNDVLMQTWKSIPPAHPDNLSAYLTALTRNIALNRRKANQRLRRGGGYIRTVIDELSECIPSSESVESDVDRHSFLASLEKFLDTLSHDARVIFVRRYWYMYTCAEIAREYRMSESKVRVTLMRTRRKYKEFLEKENLL